MTGSSPTPPQAILKWRGEKVTTEERLLRWLPRAVGILPLAVFTIGLIEQGGPEQGMPLVGALILLCSLLITFYPLVTYLTIKEYCPAEGFKDQAAPFPQFEWIHAQLFPKNGTKKGLCLQLFRFLTTSPTPFEAFKLSYVYVDGDKPEAPFHLTDHKEGDLIKFNSAIRGSDRKEYGSMNDDCKYRMNIRSINNCKALKKGMGVAVRGQPVQLRRSTPLERSSPISRPFWGLILRLQEDLRLSNTPSPSRRLDRPSQSKR